MIISTNNIYQIASLIQEGFTWNFLKSNFFISYDDYGYSDYNENTDNKKTHNTDNRQDSNGNVQFENNINNILIEGGEASDTFIEAHQKKIDHITNAIGSNESDYFKSIEETSVLELKNNYEKQTKLIKQENDEKERAKELEHNKKVESLEGELYKEREKNSQKQQSSNATIKDLQDENQKLKSFIEQNSHAFNLLKDVKEKSDIRKTFTLNQLENLKKIQKEVLITRIRLYYLNLINKPYFLKTQIINPFKTNKIEKNPSCQENDGLIKLLLIFLENRVNEIKKLCSLGKKEIYEVVKNSFNLKDKLIEVAGKKNSVALILMILVLILFIYEALLNTSLIQKIMILLVCIIIALVIDSIFCISDKFKAANEERAKILEQKKEEDNQQEIKSYNENVVKEIIAEVKKEDFLDRYEVIISYAKDSSLKNLNFNEYLDLNDVNPSNKIDLNEINIAVNFKQKNNSEEAQIL
jgi:hypothetical protein